MGTLEQNWQSGRATLSKTEYAATTLEKIIKSPRYTDSARAFVSLAALFDVSKREYATSYRLAAHFV
jgi:hypothetical protein